MIDEKLENFTHNFAKWAGSAKGFIAAFFSLSLWLFIGGVFGYSSQWENLLMIYIGTITFLMVFLMQRAQNKGLLALHVKLNELIAATNQADNNLINAEELSEKEILEAHETHRQIKTNG